MNKADYTNTILARRPCQAWAAEASEKKQAVEDAIDIAVDLICAESDDFLFATANGEETCTTSRSYILKGTNKDCRSIIDIRYGTAAQKYPLNKMTKPVAHQEKIDATDVSVTLDSYYIDEMVSGFPKIVLSGDPTAGKILYYWFRRRDVNVQEIPNEWKGVVIALAEAELFGVAGAMVSDKQVNVADPRQFDRRARKRLAKMVEEYEPFGPGQQDYPVDQRTKEENRNRNALYGY